MLLKLVCLLVVGVATVAATPDHHDNQETTDTGSTTTKFTIKLDGVPTDINSQPSVVRTTRVADYNHNLQPTTTFGVSPNNLFVRNVHTSAGYAQDQFGANEIRRIQLHNNEQFGNFHNTGIGTTYDANKIQNNQLRNTQFLNNQFRTNQFQTNQLTNTHFGLNQISTGYDANQIQNNQFRNNQFQNNPFGNNQFQNNPFGNNQFQNNPFGNNQFHNQFNTNQFRNNLLTNQYTSQQVRDNDLRINQLSTQYTGNQLRNNQFPLNNQHFGNPNQVGTRKFHINTRQLTNNRQFGSNNQRLNTRQFGANADASATTIVNERTIDDGSGTYGFRFETDTGITRQEFGTPVGHNSYAVRGSYSYTSPEGVLVHVLYTADENGFRVISPNLPPPQPGHAAVDQRIRAAQNKRIRDQLNTRTSNLNVNSYQNSLTTRNDLRNTQLTNSLTSQALFQTPVRTTVVRRPVFTSQNILHNNAVIRQNAAAYSTDSNQDEFDEAINYLVDRLASQRSNSRFGQRFGQNNNQFGQQSTRFGQDAAGFERDNFLRRPSRFGADTTIFGQDTSRFGQDTSRFGQDTSRFGQDTSRFNDGAFGVRASAFGQNSNQFERLRSPFHQRASNEFVPPTFQQQTASRLGIQQRGNRGRRLKDLRNDQEDEDNKRDEIYYVSALESGITGNAASHIFKA